MDAPLVSVVIASERGGDSLHACLDSLARQREAPPFEVVVASSRPPPPCGLQALRWIELSDRNPARRRNAAARVCSGAILAFLDDDAAAEPDWLSRGAAALRRADIAGGPDLAPLDAPYSERVSDLLLATRWIGSRVPAHERHPRGGRVRFPHDLALCNLFVARDVFEALGGFDESLGYIGEDTDFVRRALEANRIVELDPSVRVRHRRRSFPGAYLAQRWRYRVKTGRLLVQKPGLHARAPVAGLLAAGLLFSAGTARFGSRFLLRAFPVYALATWTASFPIWSRDAALFPVVPFAFALHHATYFAGLLAGIARGVAAMTARP